MKAVMERLLKAEAHTISVGPGHDFQTVQSLANRGDLTRVVHGEAPREWCTATITSQGLTRASREIAPLVVPKASQPAMVKKPWPFPFSSRGLHDQREPAPGTRMRRG